MISIGPEAEQAVREVARQFRSRFLSLGRMELHDLAQVFIDELFNTGDPDPNGQDVRCETFSRSGRALFGDRWKAGIASLLGIAPDTADEWGKGRRPVPRGVWPELDQEIARRIAELIEVRKSVVTFIEPP